MEGSGDEIGAPDSWEMADLDERMARIMILPSKQSSSSGSSASRQDEAPLCPVVSSSPSSSIAAVSGDRSGRISEEVLNQVDQFLREALEKPRERLSILRMEQDVEKFLRDPTQQQLEFQALPTSYLRLAAHRIAQHYCLQSLAVPDDILPDGSGSIIVLRKTSESRFPVIRLADIPVNLSQEDGNDIVKVAIKQRPHKGSHSIGNQSTHSSKTSQPKSVEERKEEYNRARARIFNSISSNSGATGGIPEGISAFEDNFHCSMTTPNHNERFSFDRLENNFGMDLSNSASGSSRSNRSKADNEPVVSRHRASNRVAIFRDREVERKDPDYDRNYDRYMQRFDPGFGFSGGPYTMQPLFSPAVNYNTEFPQLGSGHRPQISIEQSPRPIPQQMRGPWPVQSAPSPVGYGPPDGMLASFNPRRVGSHPASSVYMHPSHYSLPLRPGFSFVHPHDVQLFTQTHQQQSEASFGLARPR